MRIFVKFGFSFIMGYFWFIFSKFIFEIAEKSRGYFAIGGEIFVVIFALIFVFFICRKFGNFIDEI